MNKCMVAIWGQIHISIITLFFDMISGTSRRMIIPQSPWPILISFAPDSLRHFYKQKFSNLKHSSPTYSMIFKCSNNCYEQCICPHTIYNLVINVECICAVLTNTFSVASTGLMICKPHFKILHTHLNNSCDISCTLASDWVHRRDHLRTQRWCPLWDA